MRELANGLIRLLRQSTRRVTLLLAKCVIYLREILLLGKMKVSKCSAAENGYGVFVLNSMIFVSKREAF